MTKKDSFAKKDNFSVPLPLLHSPLPHVIYKKKQDWKKEILKKGDFEKGRSSKRNIFLKIWASYG